MTAEEAIEKLSQLETRMTEEDFEALESELRLRAASLGWTGDPLKQPPQVVLAVVTEILSKRGAL